MASGTRNSPRWCRRASIRIAAPPLRHRQFRQSLLARRADEAGAAVADQLRQRLALRAARRHRQGVRQDGVLRRGDAGDQPRQRPGAAAAAEELD